MGSEGFESAKRRVLLESHQAMVAALKEERFEDALESAERVLAVDPNHALTLQFYALLQEKVDMDNGDDDSGEEGEEGGAGEEDGESDSDDSSDYDFEGVAEESGANAADDGEEEEEEDEEDDEDEVEKIEYPDGIVSQPARSMKMSSEERKIMKAQLRMGIEDLKLEMERQRLGAVKPPPTPPR